MSTKINKKSEKVQQKITVSVIGGHDVIPFQIIRNPKKDDDDDTFIYTDDPYADFDQDGIIDVPISRIPDGKSPRLIARQLSDFQNLIQNPAAGAFGIANGKRQYAEDVFNLVNKEPKRYLESPPSLINDVCCHEIDRESQ